MKIKICGLTRLQDIDAVNEALPDYIGFVFAKSKRQLDPYRASEMKKRLDKRILAVGVFVNSPPEIVVELCRQGTIDLIQLHGDEDASYIGKIKEQVSNPVIKAVRVQSTQQVMEAQLLPCEYLLLDTYLSGVYGGNGKSFDWSVIPDMDKPFFLAGGISISNFISAAQCCPYCIDISSGAETEGVKDKEKITKLVAMARENDE